jgi:hypothetical protein
VTSAATIAARALGRLGKGKKKTRSEAALAAWRANIAQACAKRWPRKEKT